MEKIRCIAAERGIADRWAGCLALRCSWEYWCMMQSFMQFEDQQISISSRGEISLAKETEQRDAVRSLLPTS